MYIGLPENPYIYTADVAHVTYSRTDDTKTATCGGIEII